jgi:small conductance mechanosensitive channel
MPNPPHVDFDKLSSLAAVYAFNLVGAILVGVIGWWAAGLIERTVRRLLTSSAHMDPTVGLFLSSLAYYTVLILTFVVVLQIIGIQATSLVAVLGAASLAIGLALQGTLSNLAAGVMLLIFRPFRVGESIEVAGKNGTVKNLNLFMTELATGDNVQVLIPNGQVWGQAMTNFSAYPISRASANFVIPFDKDTARVVTELRAHLEQDKRVLDSPPPSVTTSNLTDKGVEISMLAWAKAKDVAAVRADFVQRAFAAIRA